MDESLRTTSAHEMPVTPDRATPSDGASSTNSPLTDPRALTILTTEHWSLLSARSLVYNETFARGGMFLTFLSATLVALGLLATATGFSRDFLIITAVLFALDLFIGLATTGRVAAATVEDLRYLQGMNRLRHAYHETVPGLERYFISTRYDDLESVFSAYGDVGVTTTVGNVAHGLTTMPGMISVICAAIAGVLGAVLLLLAGSTGTIAAVGAVVVFALGVALANATMFRRITGMSSSMRSNFPRPTDGGG